MKWKKTRLATVPLTLIIIVGESNAALLRSTLVANETLDNVDIIGCPNGIDWTVKHDGNNVIITLEDGTTETVDIEEYTFEVLKFADMIEDFYNSCSLKTILDSDDYYDEFDKNGYIAFWNEWHRRRGGRNIK